MESLVLMYRSGHGKVQVQVIFDTNTFWLSQQRMAELFGVTVPTINYHLDQIEQSGEIHLSDTIRKIRIPSDKWSGEVMNNMLEHFKPRLRQCMEWASPCGWGFADTIGGIYYEYFPEDD